MNASSGHACALILAGGTGGHVYPALAVADALRGLGWQVQWLGSRRGLESAVVPRAGIALHTVAVSGLRGKGVIRLLLAPLMLAGSLLQSLAVLARVRPSLVLGMGGFVAGPAGVAAWLLRRPLLIHEQNAVPGLTNRLLAPLAQVVMEAFPGSFKGRQGARVRFTGNPIRPPIADLPERAPRGPGGPLRVLVLGGSQGAEALNRVMPEAVRSLRARYGEHAIAVVHQAGPANIELTRERYAGVDGARVEAYLDDMAGAYAEADVVVARAGAMTVSELAAAGVPSVLIPFPHAVDDHQTANARYLAEHAAAVRLAQPDAGAGALAEVLGRFVEAPCELAAMARAARARGVRDATRRVVACCQEVLDG